ncbi:hypothetical protein GCM10009751_39320 [Myceligenerans crystallogenes]|uniref:Ferrous iron transport protein A n=1 Tax=Myceligenerans crystallogenes TaxID=316335 RepID=A0ABP4ZX44_9MICO
MWRGIPPGTRVVVRRRLTPGEAAAARAQRRGAVWTDVIGHVVTVSDDGVVLRTDPRPGRGEPEEIVVAAALITSVKPVPPRPVRG